MDAAIFFISIFLILISIRKTIGFSVLGFLGFCMRGGALGVESVMAIAWLAFQCFLIYLAATHVPFTIVWG